MRLVGSLMLSGGTSIGSRVRVNALSRLISSGHGPSIYAGVTSNSVRTSQSVRRRIYGRYRCQRGMVLSIEAVERLDHIATVLQLLRSPHTTRDGGGKEASLDFLSNTLCLSRAPRNATSWSAGSEVTVWHCYDGCTSAFPEGRLSQFARRKRRHCATARCQYTATMPVSTNRTSYVSSSSYWCAYRPITRLTMRNQMSARWAIYPFSPSRPRFVVQHR